MEWENLIRIDIKFIKPKRKGIFKLFPWFPNVIYSFPSQEKDQGSVHEENFIIEGSHYTFISDLELEEDYKVLKTFKIYIRESDHAKIKTRCRAFDSYVSEDWWILQRLGAWFNYPFNKLSKNWYDNPIYGGDPLLASQFIMEDLLYSCELYTYVSTYWYDSKHGLDTFTESDLCQFLRYLVKENIPTIKVIEVKNG